MTYRIEIAREAIRVQAQRDKPIRRRLWIAITELGDDPVRTAPSPSRVLTGAGH